jgi:hypothetical protein
MRLPRRTTLRMWPRPLLVQKLADRQKLSFVAVILFLVKKTSENA